MVLNWLDLVIIGWLALGAIKGILGGFVRSGVRIAGFLAAAALLYPYSQVIGGKLASIPSLADGATTWLRRSGALPQEMAQFPAGEAVDRTRRVLADLNLPAISMVAPSGMTLEEYVVTLFLQFLLGGIIFLVLLAVVYLMADLLGSALQGILGRLPLFGPINRIGGAALGIGEHAVMAALIIGLVAPVIQHFPGSAGRLISNAASVEPLLTLFRSLYRLAGL